VLQLRRLHRSVLLKSPTNYHLAMSLEVGQVFAGYTILRELGAGGMGKVFLATHPRLPREDALKVLPAEFTDDAEYRARFAREADLAAGLSHPHIVRIYDRGEDEGQLWISMDYVSGTDVSHLLRDRYQGGMPVDEVVATITAVASALDYAHHRGLLHRDVKPANILLTDPEGQHRQVYLADFGIARRIDDASGLTATNMAVGTVAYAAPEQLKGDPVDGRADQYALACTAFHMLTGAPPYVNSNQTMVIAQHVSAPPPSIGARRPELAGLDSVFAAAMAKAPDDRFGSCGDFAAELSRHLSPYHHDSSIALHAQHTQPAILLPYPAPGPPKRTQRPAVLLGALIAVALLIVGGVFAGVTLTRSHQEAAPASPELGSTGPDNKPKGTATAPAGPFTGTYRADFGPVSNLDGEQAPGAEPSTGSYGVRSVCGGAGCVATASRLQGETTFASTMVFDQVGGNWLAVALSTNRCRDSTGEIWEVFTLQARPDGTLAGEHTRTARNNCQEKRTVTFTRTGDVGAGLPDPATLPPRVVSAAEALRGHYKLTRVFVGGNPEQLGNSSINTYCLRTGDRCMSYFHSKSGDVPLIFASLSWTWEDSSSGKCPNGDPATLKATGQYPLPQPVQDPIPTLTGNGHWTQTGSCAVDIDFAETFTRTGD
jgi:serine/threonine-protein kinase